MMHHLRLCLKAVHELISVQANTVYERSRTVHDCSEQLESNCVSFSSRLGVLATPDAVVSRPVAQLSIPINGRFELIQGMWLSVLIF